MPTVGVALTDAAERMTRVGIENARQDARLIMGNVLATDLAVLIGHPERVLAVEEAAQFDHLVGRRLARQPLSHILGRREFWGLKLRVTPDTLDPRPDSECLIEAVLAHRADRRQAQRILDIGTGTGCLILALLHEFPAASGLGIDSSIAALAVARANAADLALAHRAMFSAGNWTDGVVGHYDIIISNPPYIPSDRIGALVPEVALHEPRSALDGGRDGLDSYRSLSGRLAGLLTATGLAAIEVGADQHQNAGAILAAGGLVVTDRRRDLAGHVRVLILESKT